MLAKPGIIMGQVEGSGTALANVSEVSTPSSRTRSVREFAGGGVPSIGI